MDEVGGALIAIALTLCAVFVPSAFLSGISGLFFRQFAVTISASTIISCFVSLTLSPALCAVLLRAHHEHGLSRAGLARRLLHRAFDRFNRGFDRLSFGYGNLTRRLVRGATIVLVVYAALIGVAAVEFAKTPTGFIPEQDQGYLINVVQLPAGSTLDRTEKVVRRGIDIILETTGVEHVAPFAGFDATTFTVASHAATIFSGLPSLYNHDLPGVTASTVLADLRKRLSVIKDANVLTIPPPPVQGLGSAGGFKDDAGRPCRARPRSAGQGCPLARGRGQRGCELRWRVHPVQHRFALALCGYRPVESGESGPYDDRRIFDTASVSRLTIRERLQLSWPHLSGQSPG